MGCHYQNFQGSKKSAKKGGWKDCNRQRTKISSTHDRDTNYVSTGWLAKADLTMTTPAGMPKWMGEISQDTTPRRTTEY